jgi:hypothetical protein
MSDVKRRMSPEELTLLVLKLRDEDHLTWPEMQKAVKAAGYISGRTGDYLTTSAIRFIYSRAKIGKEMFGGEKGTAISKKSADCERTMTLLRAALGMKATSDTKLAMIEQILDN